MKMPFISCHYNQAEVLINLNNVCIVSNQNGKCRFSYVGGGLTDVDESLEEVMEMISVTQRI